MAQQVRKRVKNDKKTTPNTPKVVKQKSFYEKHEVPRKVFHSLTACVTLVCYTLGFQTSHFVIPFAALSVFMVLQDVVRLRLPAINKKLIKIFGPFMRPHEEFEYNGVIFYVLGLLFLFVVFPKDVCVMGVLFLSWGDTVASIVGRELGKYTPKISERKSFAGCVGSFGVGVFSCYLFYGYIAATYLAQVDTPGQFFWTPATSRLSIHTYAVFCGLICSVSEAFDLFNIDDNLTIPVLGGSLLYGVIYLFRI